MKNVVSAMGPALLLIVYDILVSERVKFGAR